MDAEEILAPDEAFGGSFDEVGSVRQFGTVHLFNPVPVFDLVEIVPSLLTAPDTQVRAEDFVTGTLGKKVIRAQDRAGFVVNALLVPYLLSAIRMLDSGHASADDIDTGMVLGCAHPMGPLSLADLRLPLDKFVTETIRLDAVEATFERMHDGDVPRSVVVL